MNEPPPADRRFYMVSTHLQFTQGPVNIDGETAKGYVLHLGIQTPNLTHLGKVLDEVFASESADLQCTLDAVNLEIEKVDGTSIAQYIRKGGGQCDMTREIFYRSGRAFYSE